VLCLFSGQSEFTRLFKVSNLWIGPGLIWNLVVNFYFSIAIFLLLPL